jgi:hypothetical protein
VNIVGEGEAFGEMMGFVLILFTAECFAPTVDRGTGGICPNHLGRASGTTEQMMTFVHDIDHYKILVLLVMIFTIQLI